MIDFIGCHKLTVSEFSQTLTLNIATNQLPALIISRFTYVNIAFWDFRWTCYANLKCNTKILNQIKCTTQIISIALYATYMKYIRCIQELNSDQPQQLLDLCLVWSTIIILGDKTIASMHRALQAEAIAMAL